jgi:uroporphyrinogen-III decarboxylase
MSTSMDRLAAALGARATDRVPVFAFMSDQGARELGMPLKEYYSRGEHVAEAQIRMREKFGYDNVWSLFYVGKDAELLGCRRILFAANGPPNVGEMVVRSWADISRLEVPTDVTTHPVFAEQRRCLEILRREVGGKVPICAYVVSTMSFPALLMGMEKWVNLLFCGPHEVRDELLAKCRALMVLQTKAYRDAGVDVLLYADPFGSTDIVPMEFFERQSLPSIEKDIAAVGAQGIVYHGGSARVNNVIRRVLERTGIPAYAPSPLEDLVEAASILHGDALVCGMINDIRLIDWSPEEIRREVARIMTAGIPSARFLFTTAVMPYCIPEEHIRVMFEAAREFGSRRREEE